MFPKQWAWTLTQDLDPLRHSSFIYPENDKNCVCVESV